MTYTMFIWLMILFGGLWTMAMSFLVFSFLTLKRYQRMMRFIAQRLEKIEQRLTPHSSEGKKEQAAIPPSEKQFVISKDEPLAKYADVSLPESVHIDFVDTHS